MALKFGIYVGCFLYEEESGILCKLEITVPVSKKRKIDESDICFLLCNFLLKKIFKEK